MDRPLEGPSGPTSDRLPAGLLDSFDAVLLDLDGTIYHEEHPLPGAIDLIRRLQRDARPYACITNSTTSSQRLSQRLSRMAVQVDPGHIYTAAAAAADHVIDRWGNGARVFSLTTEGFQEMMDGKVRWVASMNEPCDVVVAGAPANVYATEERQRIALALLRSGAALLGICADRVYPSPRGIEFGSGAFCAYLGYAADVAPFFCGKPERAFFAKLCEKLDADPARCLLIGDNLESDIAGAKALGMKTVLTLTGVTTGAMARDASPSHRADWVVPDLTVLAR